MTNAQLPYSKPSLSQCTQRTPYLRAAAHCCTPNARFIHRSTNSGRQPHTYTLQHYTAHTQDAHSLCAGQFLLLASYPSLPPPVHQVVDSLTRVSLQSVSVIQRYGDPVALWCCALCCSTAPF